MEISVLNKHGMSIRGIAEATGLSRNMVRRYLRGGEAAAARKPAAKRREKLDPFKDYIVDTSKNPSPNRRQHDSLGLTVTTTAEGERCGGSLGSGTLTSAMRG